MISIFWKSESPAFKSQNPVYLLKKVIIMVAASVLLWQQQTIWKILINHSSFDWKFSLEGFNSDSKGFTSLLQSRGHKKQFSSPSSIKKLEKVVGSFRSFSLEMKKITVSHFGSGLFESRKSRSFSWCSWSFDYLHGFLAYKAVEKFPDG